MADVLTQINPFPGLRAFEQDEVDRFFGREEPVDELLSRLQKSRFIAVLGTSGSGKSSLVLAGLLPSLHGGIMTDAGSSWRIAKFRPGSDPIGEMAGALNQPDVFGMDEENEFARTQKTIIETTLRSSGNGLIETVKEARHIARPSACWAPS